MASKDDLFSVILENGPSSGTFSLILSKMKEEGQFRRVIQECIKALKIYPNDIHIRQLLAKTYLEDGQISQAEKELELITARINGFAGSYKLLADIYADQGRNEDAADILKVYITHQPDDTEAAQLLEGLQPSISAEEEPVSVEEPVPVPEESIPEEPSFEQELEEAITEETAFEQELEEAIPEETAPETEQEMAHPEGDLLEPEEEEPLEIATATLAELYFDQGHLPDAIDTYEKVIEQNPEDENLKARLEELKAMVAKEEEPPEDVVDPVRQRKEKMILTLESWLSAIRDDSKTGVSPN